MQAICLAAGLGTRLRPITYHVPKPLFPIAGRPNLGRIIDDLNRSGFQHIVINAFHLKEKIKEYIVSNHPDCVISEEDELLGTGGGIKNASRFLNFSSPILVVNSDVVTNFPYEVLMDYHKGNNAFATLLLTDFGPLNSIKVDDEKVIGINTGYREACLCFTGISVISPEFLSMCPNRYPFSSVDILKEAIKSGKAVRYLQGEKIFKNFFWQDLGTPKGYLKAHELFLNFKGITPPTLHQDLKVIDWAWVDEDVKIPAHTTLCRCVVWPGTEIKTTTSFKDMVLTPYGVLNGG
ncbi:Nucleotidyl transferase [Dissulfuribacter thermophilus]|uniref:Nucleotidyl transferase n=1 Tax=Dissulfuribacter thermophilus TaxID=1156395 RepID=A0A1B9F428_9BACT|nr:sugar phosphate nucleotidyltransferase [Dissulfuribacter thermophilus]OCC14574.1 Nucleotidyl transferase [Dissulfuribacter thermophilus]